MKPKSHKALRASTTPVSTSTRLTATRGMAAPSDIWVAWRLASNDTVRMGVETNGPIHAAYVVTRVSHVAVVNRGRVR